MRENTIRRPWTFCHMSEMGSKCCQGSCCYRGERQWANRHERATERQRQSTKCANTLCRRVRRCGSEAEYLRKLALPSARFFHALKQRKQNIDLVVGLLFIYQLHQVVMEEHVAFLQIVFENNVYLSNTLYSQRSLRYQSISSRFYLLWLIQMIN